MKFYQAYTYEHGASGSMYPLRDTPQECAADLGKTYESLAEYRGIFYDDIDRVGIALILV